MKSLFLLFNLGLPVYITTIPFDSKVITLKKNVKELESNKFKGFSPGLFGRGGGGGRRAAHPAPSPLIRPWTPSRFKTWHACRELETAP